MGTLHWKYFEKDWGDQRLLNTNGFQTTCQKVCKVCLSTTEPSRALSLGRAFLPSNPVTQTPRCPVFLNTEHTKRFLIPSSGIPRPSRLPPFPWRFGWVTLPCPPGHKSAVPSSELSSPSIPHRHRFTPQRGASLQRHLLISLIALTSIGDFHEDREPACHCNPGA